MCCILKHCCCYCTVWEQLVLAWLERLHAMSAVVGKVAVEIWTSSVPYCNQRRYPRSHSEYLILFSWQLDILMQLFSCMLCHPLFQMTKHQFLQLIQLHCPLPLMNLQSFVQFHQSLQLVFVPFPVDVGQTNKPFHLPCFAGNSCLPWRVTIVVYYPVRKAFPNGILRAKQVARQHNNVHLGD